MKKYILAGLSLFFLLGVVAGSFQATNLTNVDNIIQPSVLSSFFNQLKYPLLTFLLGLTFFGTVFIPIIFFARGFFLSLTIASCIQTFGNVQGLLLSLSMLGLPTIFSLPCLFILGVYGTETAILSLKALYKKTNAPLVSRFEFIRFGVCLLAIIVSALLQSYVCPLITKLPI